MIQRTPSSAGGPGTSRGFYIFIESEVLWSCLCWLRGQTHGEVVACSVTSCILCHPFTSAEDAETV